MWSFNIGIVSFVVAIFIPLIYVVGRGFKWFSATVERTEKPKDMVLVKILMGLVIGFILGSFLQQPWDNVINCKSTGASTGQCLSAIVQK
ncbi:hypothetical protein ACY2L5_004319 [Providencia rettgeri]